MTMLAPNTNSLDITRIDDEIYELVDYFYPRPNFVQVLQLYMRTDDIMNVMNCDYEEALKLFYEVRGYFGDNSMRVLIPHFCQYTGIDEAWVHLFITSLKKPVKIPPIDPGFESNYTDPFGGESRLTLAQAVETIKLGKMDSRESRRERAKQWKLFNKWGEAHYKRYDNFRMVIYSDEVASLLRVHLRTAQTMLKEIRQEYEIPRIAPISVSRFSFHYKYMEQEIRMGLACMYGEEYVAP